jgi:MFS family permease
MISRHRLLLVIDAAINLALGVALLIFLPVLVRLLGLPQAATPRFYPSLLGAVLFGIGLALLVEYLRKPGGLVGLGLGGAVAINMTAGLALAGWLVFGNLGLPSRGRVFLWGLAFVLVVISALEAARREKS